MRSSYGRGTLPKTDRRKEKIMMFLTQISGTVLQSLRLIDTGGIIMEAAIIAGLFNIGGILLRDKIFRKMTGRIRKNEAFLAEGRSTEI